MSKIADPLREYVGAQLAYDLIDVAHANTYLGIADRMDAEHERRMDQAKNDMRKAACRYMTRVVEDYKHGRKWRRKEGERCAR